MSQPSATGRTSFDALLTDVAARLTGICAVDAFDETGLVLGELASRYDLDTVFLRRHEPDDRTSVLVSSRSAGDALDPFGVLDQTASFDDHAVLAGTDRLANTSIEYRDGVTLALVPLIHGAATVGVLGAIGRNERQWPERDLASLRAVSTLFAHLWARIGAEEQLARQVNYDDLTGLPNRRRLTEALTSIGEDRPVSLLILDIDNMKVINDGLDFEIGNRFIERFAARLGSLVRPDTMVARLDGDQFAVLVTDTPPGHVERMAHRLVADLGDSIEVDGTTRGTDPAVQARVNIARSVSIGVAHNHGPFDQAVATNQELLGEADAALHVAKRHGKKRLAVFDEDMRAQALDRFATEIELRQAIEGNELTLHYQPEVDLETGEVVAVEALLRWNHPKRGLLPAGAFIETAEESGLIVEIGDQVLRVAISQLAAWQADHPDLEMWINVSPAQLMSRDVATQIQRLVDEFEVSADRICLEVTEHVVLGDLDATTGILRRLRAMGVKLALDDFGTGYSSLKQLKQLPIDALKIDMTFVAGLGVSDHDSAIVDAAITLAAAFELGTVAEGVETHQQALELRKRGCEHAQGYLLARPGPATEIEALFGQPLEIEELMWAAAGQPRT